MPSYVEPAVDDYLPFAEVLLATRNIDRHADVTISTAPGGIRLVASLGSERRAFISPTKPGLSTWAAHIELSAGKHTAMRSPRNAAGKPALLAEWLVALLDQHRDLAPISLPAVDQVHDIARTAFNEGRVALLAEALKQRGVRASVDNDFSGAFVTLKIRERELHAQPGQTDNEWIVTAGDPRQGAEQSYFHMTNGCAIEVDPEQSNQTAVLATMLDMALKTKFAEAFEVGAMQSLYEEALCLCEEQRGLA